MITFEIISWSQTFLKWSCFKQTSLSVTGGAVLTFPELDSWLLHSSDCCLVGRETPPLKQMLPAGVKVSLVMEMCTDLCAGCPQYSIWESHSAAKLPVTILKLPLPSVACPDILRMADTSPHKCQE